MVIVMMAVEMAMVMGMGISSVDVDAGEVKGLPVVHKSRAQEVKWQPTNYSCTDNELEIFT